MKFDFEELKKYQEDGLLTMRKHPDADLFSVNYTQKVQYDKLWDEITLKCRGLIVDSSGNVVARPFGKFFNLEEHSPSEIPSLPFEVFMKLDGSMGIIYWIGDSPFIASRGSFESEQALHATDVLYKKYSHTFSKLNRDCTYLFEIIYRQNRIVVDYGDMDDLVLLAVVDNNTGQESLHDVGFPMVKRYDGISDIMKLKELEKSNEEGFVVLFSNGFRVKVKFDEYVKLHRIITGVSNIAIWEYLSEGKPFDELLEKVPDEFYEWVKRTQSELVAQFDSILSESKSVFKELETRKETALYFKTQKYPSVLFSMLDGKTPDKIIWKMVRPDFSKPFKVSADL